MPINSQYRLLPMINLINCNYQLSVSTMGLCCVECIVESVTTVFSTPIDFRFIGCDQHFFARFCCCCCWGGGVLDEILYLHKQNRHLSRFGNLATATTTTTATKIYIIFVFFSPWKWFERHRVNTQHTHTHCERRRKLHFYLYQTNSTELLFNDTTRHMHTWSKLPGIISERFSASIPNVNSHWQQ